ncbi:MAG: hypothetical protein IJM18_03730 [Clostridia bacterium]|nr:hypothetical protein [Clostridia bacterium]
MAKLEFSFVPRLKKREPIDDIPKKERPSPETEPNAAAPAAAGGEEPRPKGSLFSSVPRMAPRSAAPLQAPAVEENSEPQAVPNADEAPAAQSGEGSGHDEGAEYDIDAGLSEFYNRLRSKLNAYGISSIPSFGELYSLFESFLRPAIDAAIAARNRRGRTNMAELDADAYARGMGGSSYLTSMKAREQDDIDSDINELEGKYGASMAEYLYKALTAMQQMESEIAKTRMTLMARYSYSGSNGGRGGRSNKGGKGKEKDDDKPSGTYGHNKYGAYFDGKWYEGDFSYLKKNASYTDYAEYLSSLSPSERYLFFTSSQRTWRLKRWQIQYNLPQVDYMDLYNSFMSSPGGLGSYYGPRNGGGKWLNLPY